MRKLTKIQVKFVVINENIFGTVMNIQPNQAGVLASSTIRGASHGWRDGPYPLPVNGDGVRPATREDFEIFRVGISQYEAPCSTHNYDVPTS